MASLKPSVFNFAGRKGGGAFGGLLQSDHVHLNWRNDPNIVHYREYLRNKIGSFLAQNATGKFGEQIVELSDYLENQLFMDALSKEDYINHEEFHSRVLSLIQRKWLHNRAAQAETTSRSSPTLLMSPAAPTSSVLKSNVGVNSLDPFSDVTMAASTGCNMDYTDELRPRLSADVSSSSLAGSQKFPPQSGWVMSNNFSPREALYTSEPVDSGPTFSGSVLQYDSEASSFESHHKSYQFAEDELNLIMRSGNNSLSVYTQPKVGDKLRSESVEVSAMHVLKPMENLDPFEPQHTGSGIEMTGSQASHGINHGSKNAASDAAGEHFRPRKCRKADDSLLKKGFSDDYLPLMDHSVCNEGTLKPQRWSESPVSVNSDAANLENETAVIPSQDAGSSEPGNISLDGPKGLDSEGALACSEGPSVDFIRKGIEPLSPSDMKYDASDSPRPIASKSVAASFEEKVAQNEDLMRATSQENKIDSTSLLHVPVVSSVPVVKSEKQKIEGISLTEFFTVDEIEQHISSLRQKDDQSEDKEVMGNATSHSVNENFCQLCAMEKLMFPPMPIYCLSCSVRIKNYGTYYSAQDEIRGEVCLCSTCYNKSRGGNILSIPKANLEMRKNDVVTEEAWVQCDKCEGWQHQICALFNDKSDAGGKAEYTCPKCYISDIKAGKCVPLSRTSGCSACNLPRTLLSDHIEERLLRRLEQERKDRTKDASKDPAEVLEAGDLFVRVVSSVDKKLKVKQQFLDIFHDKSYPAEFPYRSKVVLLFQRIEGVDVCLFAMYVQEFGSECSLPNQRCIYISYLDSVKYFRPEIKAATGEALRTFVYHEILIGYLDYCKKRGFATCYIWACPPVKGEDYILYCHPETQKTPKPEKLRQWYQSMLKKATKEKIVLNFTNLYEQFFVPTGESNTKVTAARLPYFDGDYWSSIADSVIKKIEQESSGDLQKKVQKITRRSLKAMGHINPSADDAKDILLMQELGQNISSAKEDFIIVRLQFICTHCHEVILTGKRWFCNQCKNFQLCERCHDTVRDLELEDSHSTSSGQKHPLSQEVVNDVATNTEDNDALIGNCFLENRHAFLSFCQGNHYQFDTLRRAKHSSMMILYHLHNPCRSNFGTSCSLCLKEIAADEWWKCDICTDFSVCVACYQRSNAACHTHALTRSLPSATGRSESKRVQLLRELLDVLLHASKCDAPHPCSYPNCVLIRRLFSHARLCKVRVAGGCCHCQKTWFILAMHSRTCKDVNCRVPRCLDLRRYAER